ncbi:MAG: hybrid sensor histidine kinase/response regulator [Chitinivibrionales bacterium]
MALPTPNSGAPEWYSSVMELLPNIVYQVDQDGKFTYVNDAVRILGYKPEQLIGKHFSELIHDEDYQRVSRNHVLPAFAGKMTGESNAPKLFDERRSGLRGTTGLEIRLKTNARQTRGADQCLHVQVNASGYYENIAEAPSFLGTIGVIQDVTVQRKTEARFKQLEAQLNQAQKTEVLGQLAGGIAHDFNNMLSGISGYAEIISRDNRDEKGNLKDKRLALYIQTVINASKRAAELSSKLLAFSRQGKYEIKTVDLHHVISESVLLLERTIDRGIEITKQLIAPHCLITGDPAQIQSAILNLAMNARDAMSKGGKITLSTRVEQISEQNNETDEPFQRLTPGKYVVMEIKDTGIGMDKKLQEHIFKPFFTTKPEGKGTGLGLASVQSTMKNHLGEISVKSAPGEGTAFTLYFPAASAPATISAEPLRDQEARAKKGNILVIDDESIIRDLLLHMLSDVGYTVIACENGLQARDYFAAHQENIDLIILDINMPVMNGIDCLEEMRSIDPRVRTIIMTGHAVSDETKKRVNGNNACFLRKPFDFNQIAKMVDEILTRSPQG